MIHAIQIGSLSLPAGFLLLVLATGIALWTGHLLARGAGVDVEGRLYRALLAGVTKNAPDGVGCRPISWVPVDTTQQGIPFLDMQWRHRCLVAVNFSILIKFMKF